MNVQMDRQCMEFPKRQASGARLPRIAGRMGGASNNSSTLQTQQVQIAARVCSTNRPTHSFIRAILSNLKVVGAPKSQKPVHSATSSATHAKFSILNKWKFKARIRKTNCTSVNPEIIRIHLTIFQLKVF